MRSLLTTIVGLLFVSAIASGAAESVVTLNNISVEADSKFSAVTLRLSAKPAWKKITPTIHGTFAQFDLPQTFVTNPGKFVEGTGNFILKRIRKIL